MINTGIAFNRSVYDAVRAGDFDFFADGYRTAPNSPRINCVLFGPAAAAAYAVAESTLRVRANIP